MKSLILALLAVFSHPLWARNHQIYRSTQWKPQTAQVVVVIHGCLQSARTMKRYTGWNQLADKHNLLIFYPNVPARTNPMDCWNWFKPENQIASGGQLRMIAEDLRQLIKSEGIEKAPVYVTGLSSGSVTAAGLLACFPDLFAGGALHSGPAYASARNLEQAELVLKEGPGVENPPSPCHPKNFKGKLMILHGTKDSVVNPLHVPRTLMNFRGTESLPMVEEKEGNGLKYSVSRDSTNQTQVVLVEGLGHAWSGFAKAKLGLVPPYFSAQGPSSTELMWSFFSER